uniref:COX6C domain-containing protein n=1 Tax=Elaeophora elaphi TaxID=1147741 RepID=A0A0R3RU86_9BILA
MRLSALKLCLKIIDATAKISRRNLLRICGTIVIAEIVLAAYVEEFALPTPDIVYDFHMKFSRDFADFAMGNKYGAGALRYVGTVKEAKVIK